MAGHSKWANIKHKKASADAKRGKVFTKMAKLITVAAQQGGGDPEMNPSLRLAVQKAKVAGVPADNIQRAIKKGTGELKDGARLEEVVHEGYGPDGVALLIRCLTDNTKRTYSNIRHIMDKNGGNLGGSGCVSWMFERKGVIAADTAKIPVDEREDFELQLIEVGVEDFEWDQGGEIFVITPPEAFEQVLAVFHNYPVQKSEISLLATEKKIITDAQTQEKISRLVELLEDDEDVDEVFINSDFHV